LAGLEKNPWADYFTVQQEITEEMREKVGLLDG
jgi:hypothetical protein